MTFSILLLFSGNVCGSMASMWGCVFVEYYPSNHGDHHLPSSATHTQAVKCMKLCVSR